MEERIKDIMASVFHLNVNEIDDNASPDTIEQWDSLRHMHLIVGLEEEFGLTFKEDEIIEMLSYKSIYDILNKKLS